MTNIKDMHTDDAGYAFIQKWEGWYAKAYLDPVGVWTIGYGYIGEDYAYEGNRITKKQGLVLLKKDVEEAEKYVKHYVKVELTQNQFNAMVSFVMNAGPGTLKKSTLLKLLNRGNYSGAAAQFESHSHGTNRDTGVKSKIQGLVNRRKDEAAMFTRGTPVKAVEIGEDHDLDGPQEYEGNITPDETAEKKSGAFWEVVTKTDTFKAIMATVMALITAITQLLQNMQENPILAGSIVMALAGLVGVFFVKYRDTTEGR